MLLWVFKDWERLQHPRGLISRDVGSSARVTVTHKPFYVPKHIAPVIARAEQLIGLVSARVCCGDLIVSFTDQSSPQVSLWYY
jgi:hypothetical protein